MDLPKLSLHQDSLSNLGNALDKEWIITNGLGGYASSTVLGINTRKYHGLLIAAFNPPVNRWLLLSKLDETLKIGNNKFELGANEFKDVIYPKGFQFLSDFALSPLPISTYTVNDVTLQKTIFMPYMKNATAVIYEVNNPLSQEVEVNISPLVNSRHIYHTTNKSRLNWNFVQKNHGEAISIDSSDFVSSLILSSSDDGTFVEECWWVEKLFFRTDASRSESSTEDVFRPGFFHFVVPSNERKRFCILAVAGKNAGQAKSHFSSFDASIERIDTLCTEEISRRKELVNQFRQSNVGVELEDWLKWIVQAADSFVVSRASTGKKSVIAGYHWFDDWGRDSLISLPGLTLVTGKFETAKEILLTFDRNCNKGVIPNRFSDKAGDIPLYNTVDATLWFFDAILQYLKYTGDFDFVQKQLWNTLTEIMNYHIQGTIFGIHMDQDGLLMHGPQLTWMDATTVDGFVTPRDGKAVEIQALWYNALKIMELLAKRFSQTQKMDDYRRIAEKAKISFNSKFWNQDGYLNDVLTKDGPDSTFRPNQVIAASLDFSMLENQKKRLVVEAVRSRLWGKFGLKTLPEIDSRFMGTYLGDWKHRDTAYHNGTVWAWLLGPFVTAFLKTKNHEELWRNFAFENFLQPLFQVQLSQAGLGTISEIFDGNSPHSPQGCISQAWSVAEPLRAYVEDVALNRPTKEKEIMAAFLDMA